MTGGVCTGVEKDRKMSGRGNEKEKIRKERSRLCMNPEVKKKKKGGDMNGESVRMLRGDGQCSYVTE